MATTTNYSWTTPDDTGLVKDGASAIRSLGTAIDSTVYSNAQAAIAKTIVDAKGDIIAATAADTVARVAVGTDGQVLTADAASSAGVKWATASAGSMTLLSTTTLSGTTTSINSISQSYKHLFIELYGYTWNTANSAVWIKFNGGTQTFYSADIQSDTTTVRNQSSYLQTANSTNIDRTYTGHLTQITVYNYASTAIQKSAIKSSFVKNTTGTYMAFTGGGTWNDTTALSSLDIIVADGYTFSGGTVKVWGIN